MIGIAKQETNKKTQNQKWRAEKTLQYYHFDCKHFVAMKGKIKDKWAKQELESRFNEPKLYMSKLIGNTKERVPHSMNVKTIERLREMDGRKNEVEKKNKNQKKKKKKKAGAHAL